MNNRAESALSYVAGRGGQTFGNLAGLISIRQRKQQLLWLQVGCCRVYQYKAAFAKPSQCRDAVVSADMEDWGEDVEDAEYTPLV